MDIISKAKLILAPALVASTLFLAGCSDGPGASDIKNILNSKTNEFNEIADVEIVEVKEIETTDGEFGVKFKYTVEFTKSSKDIVDSAKTTRDRVNMSRYVKRFGEFDEGHTIEEEGGAIFKEVDGEWVKL